MWAPKMKPPYPPWPSLCTPLKDLGGEVLREIDTYLKELLVSSNRQGSMRNHVGDGGVTHHGQELVWIFIKMFQITSIAVF